MFYCILIVSLGKMHKFPLVGAHQKLRNCKGGGSYKLHFVLTKSSEMVKEVDVDYLFPLKMHGLNRGGCFLH